MKTPITLIVLIFIVFSCKNDNVSSQEQSNSLIVPKDSCKVDSIISKNRFPYSPNDTIQISSGFPREKIDSSLRKLIGRGRHSKLYNYSVIKSGNNRILTIIEDEEETISASIYIINDCKLTDRLVVAETSAWEHGNKNTKSVITDDTLITSIKQWASKDWGDYTQWQHGEKVNKYKIDVNGKIISVD